MNPTKLVLHFSDFSVIFYAIYKKQGNSLYYFSCTFAAGTLERTLALQCGPWARLAGAGEPNSGKVRRGLAGEGWGGGLGTSGARFGHLAGTVVAPASSSPAAREGRPWWSLFRRGEGRGEGVEWFGSFLRGEGTWRKTCCGSRSAGHRSSPRLALMAPAAARLRRGGLVRRGRGTAAPL
jgi:hypothetical protein